ncbi:MAG TPA: alpha/beta fold hydrolase, partial [Chitinophagaceae bacterium]
HFTYETVHLTTSNHLTLEAWYIPADSARGTVILLHGMGQNKSMLLKEAYEFMYLGFNVMLTDLRAHGNSSGNVSTIGFLESEDVKLAYDYVAKKGDSNIILYGVSLGATVITKAIFDYDLSPSRIILDMPFEKLEKLFGKRGTMLGFPEEPFGALVTFWAGVERGFNAFNVNASKYAEKIKCPVLLEYGALDKIVSKKETNSIFEHIASNNKKLVKYENADHEFFLNKDPLKWRKEIKDFLQ